MWQGVQYQVQAAQLNKDSDTNLPRVIAISSGKGGVGKSSITVNLGIALAKSGAKVCLLDADTGLANANILLGLSPEFSLEHVLYGAKPIEEVMLTGPYGLKIIPGANGISECVSLHPRQQLRLTRELARIEGDFDFLLIDTAAGIAETTLDFVSAAHHTVVVITPEPTSLTDAFSLIKLLKRRRSKLQFHVVVNMCSSVSQAKEVFNRFRAAVDKYIGVQSHYLGFLLRDESMRVAVELQNPVTMFPDSDPSCRSFTKLAADLDKVSREVPGTESFSGYWQRQFRDRRSGNDVKDSRSGAAGAPTTEKFENRDSDYLSELRSRTLLLIEQGNAAPELISTLLQESVSAYIERHHESPIDVVETIEQLLSSPGRDDGLMREIANRVRPWVDLTSSPPTDELSGHVPVQQIGTGGRQELVENSQSLTATHVTPSLTDAEVPVLVTEVEVTEPVDEDDNGSHENVNIAGVKASFLARTHVYDTSRFGSQDHLLDLLRRSEGKSQSVQDLLDALA
jgi:MinD-like ATPase involved in chromosome partitioning or flagellar assembly